MSTQWSSGSCLVQVSRNQGTAPHGTERWKGQDLPLSRPRYEGRLRRNQTGRAGPDEGNWAMCLTPNNATWEVDGRAASMREVEETPLSA